MVSPTHWKCSIISNITLHITLFAENNFQILYYCELQNKAKQSKQMSVLDQETVALKVQQWIKKKESPTANYLFRTFNTKTKVNLTQTYQNKVAI